MVLGSLNSDISSNTQLTVIIVQSGALVTQPVLWELFYIPGLRWYLVPMTGTILFC